MRMTVTVVLAGIVFAGFAAAAELKFPDTEAKIVDALRLKDGRTVHQGVEYLSEGGKVYKVVGGKRFRMRGLAAIEDADIVPKAGALVQFDLDKATIRTESRPLLDEFGHALKGGLADATLTIVGHTDSSGADTYNMALSLARATAVRDYLVREHGIAAGRLEVKGLGKTRPIASNDSESGRAMNRRVEFVREE